MIADKLEELAAEARALSQKPAFSRRLAEEQAKAHIQSLADQNDRLKRLSPFIVGIGHRARVGKDTAASALCASLGFVQRGFADPLKALALECDPIISPGQTMVNQLNNTRLKWIIQGLGGWEKTKDTYPEARRFLQNLGVGARKVFGENFWIDQAFNELGTEPVVFADVRFENEVEAIRSRGGVVIDIVRAVPPTVAHVSETELDGFDFDEVFVNDQGIAELQATVVAWVKNRMEQK